MNLVLAGTQGFTKSGAGELLLDDANTFTSSVAINAGTLAFGNATALGSTSNTVTVNTGATLDLGRPGDRGKLIDDLRNWRGRQRCPDQQWRDRGKLFRNDQRQRPVSIGGSGDTHSAEASTALPIC